MAKQATRKQQREERIQKLQAAIDATEAQMEDLVWRNRARREAAELQAMDEFADDSLQMTTEALAESCECDQDATTYYCLSIRRDTLCMELKTA